MEGAEGVDHHLGDLEEGRRGQTPAVRPADNTADNRQRMLGIRRMRHKDPGPRNIERTGSCNRLGYRLRGHLVGGLAQAWTAIAAHRIHRTQLLRLRTPVGHLVGIPRLHNLVVEEDFL